MISGRSTVGDYWRLDVRHLHRDRRLTPGYRLTVRWSINDTDRAAINIDVQPDRLIFHYRHRAGGGDWKDEDYPVLLDWTGCNYGGRRVWLRCPSCGRRCAVLYGGSVYACRHCHRLAYESTREDAGDRALRAGNKIRERLGWTPGVLNEPGDKPKWMRWPTYFRLVGRHHDAAHRSMACLMAKYKLSGVNR